MSRAAEATEKTAWVVKLSKPLLRGLWLVHVWHSHFFSFSFLFCLCMWLCLNVLVFLGICICTPIFHKCVYIFFVSAYLVCRLLIWQTIDSDPFYWSLRALYCTSLDLINGNKPSQGKNWCTTGFFAQGGPWRFPWDPTRKDIKAAFTITGWSTWAAVSVVENS